MTGQFRIEDAVPELFAGLLRAAIPPDPQDAAHWAQVLLRMQTMWLEFLASRAESPDPVWRAQFPDPAWLARVLEGRDGLEELQQGWSELLALLETPFEAGGNTDPDDARFAGAQWRERPEFALLKQSYLHLCNQLETALHKVPATDPAAQGRRDFFLKLIADALSPSNFPLTNPVVIERAKATRGESLIKGLEHLIADLGRGQITHSLPGAFRIGENIAVTPGTVVHETPLYQLIQYAPTTPQVLAAPLVIFPPWINRFYILDLNPGKSFVRWAVEQGITVFMVSWRSADASLAEATWDNYITAQIDAIDTVRARLDVPAVHAIGYCVAGTTLAATLAVLARRDEADKVASATLFTAQVDFEEAGDLKHFIDERLIAAFGELAPEGYLDGRCMAMVFNLLRARELLWSYAERHYLLGEPYRAFDLLHWNGDVTNLPAIWHANYLQDLYLDNRLVQPDSLSALGMPIDLSRITTPCYIQAGREDHIAPPHSVWKITRHLNAPWTFVLAGSGHIAGVVNPPAANKYQFWTNPSARDGFDGFLAGAIESPGSWWPHWAEWLRTHSPKCVPAKGRRKPGGKRDPGIEAAPGRYVGMR